MTPNHSLEAPPARHCGRWYALRCARPASAVVAESPNPTALIIAVPEVESLVSVFRVRHDSAFAEGVPAHITVLYPFLKSSRISKSVVRAFDEVFLRASETSDFVL